MRDYIRKRGSNLMLDFFQNNKDVIEVICAILSVFVLGLFTVLFTQKSNALLGKHVKIEEALAKPNTNIDITWNEDNSIKQIDFANAGSAMNNCVIEIFPYVVAQMCERKGDGYVAGGHPSLVPIYEWPTAQIFSLRNYSTISGKIASLSLSQVGYQFLDDLGNLRAYLTTKYQANKDELFISNCSLEVFIHITYTDLFDNVLTDSYQCILGHNYQSFMFVVHYVNDAQRLC